MKTLRYGLPGALMLAMMVAGSQAGTPQENFESVYGQTARGLAANDIPAFVQRLVDDSGKLKDDAPMAAYLLDKAVEFLMKSPAGAEKTRAGDSLVEALTAQAEAHMAEKQSADAVRLYERAAQVATAIRSQKLADIQGKIKDAATKVIAEKRLIELQGKLQQQPDNAATATALVLLCVVEFDRPADAVKFLPAAKDPALDARVKLAATSQPAQPQDSKQLGDWYRTLAAAASTSPQAKLAMLARARSHYERFLQDYAKQDAEALAARKAVEDINKELNKPAMPMSGALWNALARSIAAKEVKETPEVGAQRDQAYRDEPEQGGLLIGFKITEGKFIDVDFVQSFQPIFLVRGGVEQLGAMHGKTTAKSVVLKAKPGYAVSAINLRAGLNLDGMQLVFAKIKAAGLDPSDTYTSEWAGNTRGGSPKAIDGAGNFVIGIHGKAGATQPVGSIGLIYVAPAK